MGLARCADRCLLPYGALWTALRDAGAEDEDRAGAHGSVARCELGGGHEGEHAEFQFAADPELWARWDEDGTVRLVRLTPCAQPDETLPPLDRQPCTLPAGHASGHSWELA